MNQEKIINQEKNFIAWAQTIISKANKPFNLNTIMSYVQALKEKTTLLTLSVKIKSKNIFQYNNLKEFESLFEQIKNDPNYNDVNNNSKDIRPRTYGAALSLYKRFLEEQGGLHEINFLNIDIQENIDVQGTVALSSSSNIYTKAAFLREVFMEEKKYDAIKALLLKKKNIIFQGSPGVGKTFAAKRFAYSILGVKNDQQVKMVQFHQNYSYEDFIMGYRPNEQHFELKYGPFYCFCKEAEKNKDQQYFFIIDEINRGQLSKIFGELLMLMEADNRGTALPLLYNNEDFSVPSNLYIIGMMNTADRSLAMIDYALRRRFSFINFDPAFETTNFKTYCNTKNNTQYAKVINTVIELNKEITQDTALGDGFQIGHSYFCTSDKVSTQWLESVIEYEIIPLLKEYWFDDLDKIQLWSNKFRNIYSGKI